MEMSETQNDEAYSVRGNEARIGVEDAQPSTYKQNLRILYWVTWVGFAVNLLLSLLKLSAGLLGHSRALVADGVHSFTDLATDLAVLIGAHYWSAPADQCHPHGHGRIETLVTAFIGLCLGGAAIGLGFEAVTSYGHKTLQPSWIALIAALASIVIKEILFRWTRLKARQANSKAMEANAWHHRSDAFSSIPASMAIAVAMFFPGYEFADSVGAILVCIFILHAAWKITLPAMSELIDRAAPAEKVARMETSALEVPGVRLVHAMRSRSLGQGFQVDLHVQVDPHLTVEAGHAIAHQVRQRLIDTFADVTDVITHIEPYQPKD